MVFLISAFVFFPGALTAQYNYSKSCQLAYQEILKFRFDHAGALLEEDRVADPDNLIPVLLENYIDFFKLFTTEDKDLFDKLKPAKSLRLDRLEKGDKESPYYRYCMAGINLQWAFVRLKFGEYTTAAFEIRRAFLLLTENEKRFPDFLPNQIGLGILHIIVGLVPEQYQWLANLAGMEGTIEEGTEELKAVLGYAGDDPVFNLFKPESCFYLAFVDINLLNDKKESLALVRRFDQDPLLKSYQTSPLIVYAKSSIYLKSGKNSEVIALLADYQPAPGTYPFVFLSYLEGLARLNHLDSSAIPLLNRFEKEFTGINYIKAGYQKLAWAYLLQGDTAGYREEMKKAATRGNSIVDEDKQAVLEYQTGAVPAIPLLKARLLYDGGYYQEALKVLLGTPLDNYMRNKRDLTEYLYRMGRIYHAMGNRPKSIQYYSSAIGSGRDLPYYFAANAALNLGWIFEEEGNYTAADTNFRLCLSMNYDEYRNSLRQKAKAGLNRLKKVQD